MDVEAALTYLADHHDLHVVRTKYLTAEQREALDDLEDDDRDDDVEYSRGWSFISLGSLRRRSSRDVTYRPPDAETLEAALRHQFDRIRERATSQLERATAKASEQARVLDAIARLDQP